MFFDFAIGVFSALFFADNNDTAFTYGFLIWSIFCAFAPDIDVAITIFRGESIAGHRDQLFDHRKYLHYPLPWLFVLWTIDLMWPTHWALVAAVNVSWHFFHDSFSDGWGLPWLWPLEKSNYKLFSDSEGRTSPLYLFSAWTSEELKMAFHNHGLTTNNWLKEMIRSPMFWVEIFFFFLACFVLILYVI